MAEVVQVQLPPWPCMAPMGIDQIGTAGTWRASLLLIHLELQTSLHILALKYLSKKDKSFKEQSVYSIESVCFHGLADCVPKKWV